MTIGILIEERIGFDFQHDGDFVVAQKGVGVEIWGEAIGHAVEHARFSGDPRIVGD